jgi:SAM-dependent methyltransferase
MKICEFCKCNKIKKHWYYSNLLICDNCELGFNDITHKFDYNSDTDFELSDKKMRIWRKFAERDFSLLNIDFTGKTILEIGCGYGFLGSLIEDRYENVKYLYNEANADMKTFLKSCDKSVLENCFDYEGKVDIIILNHVFEHICDASIFFESLNNKYNNSEIILFQTNYQGIIPRLFPFLWYGYSFDQHYYHFSIKSILKFFNKYGYEMSLHKYYKLDQAFSFTIKGFAKLFLSFINVFIAGKNSDAFMIYLKKTNTDKVTK